jgi:hypothetical protein
MRVAGVEGPLPVLVATRQPGQPTPAGHQTFRRACRWPFQPAPATQQTQGFRPAYGFARLGCLPPASINHEVRLKARRPIKLQADTVGGHIHRQHPCFQQGYAASTQILAQRSIEDLPVQQPLAVSQAVMTRPVDFPSCGGDRCAAGLPQPDGAQGMQDPLGGAFNGVETTPVADHRDPVAQAQQPQRRCRPRRAGAQYGYVFSAHSGSLVCGPLRMACCRK